MKLVVLFFLLLGFSLASQLEKLIKITKENNISLKVFHHKERAFLNKSKLLLSLPNPELRFTFRNFDTEGIFPRRENPMGSYTISFIQKYTLFAKRTTFSEIFRIKAFRERIQREVYLHKILLKLKKDYYELLYLWEKEKYLHRILKEIRKLRKITEEKYIYGKVPLSDLLLLKAEGLKVESTIKETQAKKELLKREINYLLGRKVQIEYEPLKLEDFPRVIDIEGSPYVLLKKVEIEIVKKELKRAELEYLPDFKLHAEYSIRPELPDLISLGFSISLPIYYKNRERFLVLEAVERLNAKKRELEDIKLRIKESLEGLKKEYTLLKESLESVSKEITTKKREIEALLIAYEYEETDIREILRAYRILWSLEIERYRLVAEINKVVAEAEALL